MDLLAAYSEDASGDAPAPPAPPPRPGAPRLLLAPSAVPGPTAASAVLAHQPSALGPLVVHCAPAAAAAGGPGAARGALGRTITGSVHEHGLDEGAFTAQFNSFSARGVALDPGGSGALVGSRQALEAARSSGGGGGGGGAGGGGGTVKRRRERNDDAASEGFLGPWAGYAGEAQSKVSGLEAGSLTLAQKLIRLDQGLNPEGPGKLDGEALTVARQRLEALAKAASEGAGSEGSSSSSSSSSSAGGGGGGGKGPLAVEEEGGAAAASAGGAGGAAQASSAPSAAEAAAAAAAAAANAALYNGASLDAATAASASSSSSSASTAPQRILPPAACTSTFHGSGAIDYQGRAWTAAPKGMRSDGGDHECYLPKRCVHKFTGHTKGVQGVSFFPGTGHLLLSAGLDGRAKVWDCVGGSGTGGRRAVRRTYAGHTAGVRQAVWCADGSRFATASYDRSVKVWDTETGACTASLPIGAVAYCVAWAPSEDPHVLMVGTASRKVQQWDLRQAGGDTGLASAAAAASGEPAGGGYMGASGLGARSGGGGGSGSGAAPGIVPASVLSVAKPALLEYDRHLGPVNTVTFFDGGRRFLSTSDDKRVLVWDYGTPVPIKEFQDPSMHAVSAAVLHPGGGFVTGQSQDNTLVTYAVGERSGRALKKSFKGHTASGYACQPCYSPDGQFLASGDGDGSLWFWQWASGRVLKSIPRAHANGPATGLDWHPLEPATMASSGWDGVICLWGE